MGGGAAVFLAAAAVLGGLIWYAAPWHMQVNEDWSNLLGAGIACSWIVALGLLDDRFGLRGRQKLAGQIVAAGILIACGVHDPQNRALRLRNRPGPAGDSRHRCSGSPAPSTP